MNVRLSLLIVLPLCAAACRAGSAAPTAAPTATVIPFPTFPPTPTETEAVPDTPTRTTSPTGPTSTAAATGDQTSPATPGTGTPADPGTDRAEFVSDVTVPDGTDFAPGVTFTKTWRVKNVGTSTWTQDYLMEFVLGTNMAAVSQINFPQDVPPGQTVDLSVEMTAPATGGTHSSLWHFRNPSGATFGVGLNSSDVIYVQIDVVGGPASPVRAASATPVRSATPAGTRAPTRTPSGPLNPIKVNRVSLSVNNASVTGNCPHTFVFTAIIEAEGGGTIRYQLEASTTSEGFQFSLPAVLESTFDTNGPHTHGVQYTLEIRDTVSAQAWVHILSPVDMQSERVAFALTCPTQPPPPPTVPPAATTTPTPASTP
jgi:hypothetical protein